jgi:hypothetical protein
MLWAFLGAVVGSVIGPLAPKIIDFFLENGVSLERKRDAALQEVCVSIDVVLTCSEEYWPNTDDGSPQLRILQSKMVAHLQNIQMLLPSLFEATSQSLKNSRDEWKALHAITTGGDFGEPDRVADGRRLTAIYQDALTLKRGVQIRRGQLKRKFMTNK